jgi:cytochrome d ubiquinol oxidase subunit II
MSILPILWYFLIFLLIAGYFVLDGFDLGIGVLYPFICKTDEEKHIARRAIGPVWDGNEVWLLTAGGALFAAFPDAYATTFSGFYLAIMLVLFGLIVRAVSFEFWEGDPKWRRVWDACFFVGSLLPAILLGVAVGNIFAGVPMDALGNYAGVPLLGLVNAFTLLVGLLGLMMFISAGASWLALKAPVGSALQARAQKVRANFQLVQIVFFIGVTVVVLTGGAGTNVAPAELGAARILFVVLVAVGMIGSFAIGSRGAKSAQAGQSNSDLVAFLLQSLAAIAIVFLLACSMFPVLVNASADSIGAAITAASAGASTTSLATMTVILCIGLPFVLVYHVLIYRTFRGRIATDAKAYE